MSASPHATVLQSRALCTGHKVTRILNRRKLPSVDVDTSESRSEFVEHPMLKSSALELAETWQRTLSLVTLSVVYFALVASMLVVVMPDLGGFARNLLFSEFIGLAILGWGVGIRRFLPIERLNFLVAQVLTIVAAVPLGYAMGRVLALALLGEPLRVLDWGQPRVVPYLATVLTSILAMGFMAMHEQSIKDLAARSDAQLRLLRAQLEPHMLFNTLATLRSLVEEDPRQAQRMIDQVITYLRGTLAASRTQMTTLSSEFEQLQAYLEIMSLRMGARLSYTLELPEMLRGEAIPSMLLQPLVENAIKHGLEPKVGSGWLAVKVRRAGAGLEICVTDSGVGLPEDALQADATTDSKPSKGGYGLLHVRERLRTIYGANASLQLARETPGGVNATVRVPL
jgi:signal transduction histidine kinase